MLYVPSQTEFGHPESPKNEIQKLQQDASPFFQLLESLCELSYTIVGS